MNLWNKFIEWMKSGNGNTGGYIHGDPTDSPIHHQNDGSLEPKDSISVEIPVTDIIEAIQGKESIYINKFEEDRQKRIDEIVNAEMAEVCNEDPKLRKRV